ncbi:unnamed protein product, partial [marine sediment metagenome]
MLELPIKAIVLRIKFIKIFLGIYPNTDPGSYDILNAIEK